MSTKILVGLLAIFGLLGLGFAWGGFMNPIPLGELPDDVKEEFKTAFQERDLETLKELREQYMPQGPLAELDEETRDEILSLREDIHDAMVSGDYEKAEELRGEMKELLPEDFRPLGPRIGMRGLGHWRGVHEGCPFAQ